LLAVIILLLLNVSEDSNPAVLVSSALTEGRRLRRASREPSGCDGHGDRT